MKCSQLPWTWTYPLNLAQNRDRWLAYVNVVMNLWVM